MPGGGTAVAVAVVGLSACTLPPREVGAASGEVVTVSGADVGLVAPLDLKAVTWRGYRWNDGRSGGGR